MMFFQREQTVHLAHKAFKREMFDNQKGEMKHQMAFTSCIQNSREKRRKEEKRKKKNVAIM